MGYGWSDNWQWSLSTDTSDGTITVVTPDGQRRIFQPDSRQADHYISQPGDQATLLLSANGKTYSLREADGTLYVFSAADGSLQSVADPNGDCITLQYTAGRLTKLSDASGQQWLQIAYYPAGQIESLTDSVGQETVFSYDTAQQLSTVTNDGLTTTYTYYTGTVAAQAHTLASITAPGNVHEYFSCDSLGRLAKISDDGPDDGPAKLLGFAYNSAGDVTVTDATNDATNYDFDYRGLIVKVQDPLDRSVQLTYNSANELTQVTDASGDSYSAQYDANGNLTDYTDPLGHQVQFSYQTLGTAAAGNFYRLASYTDPDGNQETYTYNAQGDLLTTGNADGTTETLTYPNGVDPTTSTNGCGQQIAYTYDSAGRVLSETFPDGSHVTYSYDTRGNLIQTTDATGTTTYHYSNDSHDYLSEIDYPGGQFLKFTYNAAGQRASMTDQDGHVTNYSYDADGRLQKLTDGSNRLIDLYQYNADGQLSQETKGNGTSTTYQYNAAGQIVLLVNYAPDGKTVLSSFKYSYATTGLCSGMTTLDGQWTYGYDADGELTTATFQSKNPAIVPNQSLSYQYDAAGNRVSVTQNGVTTPYTTNNLNQYTSIGTASYYYDADGNLVCQQDGAGGATYTYDAENRLIQTVNSQGTWNYQYDALGHLAAVIHNGQKTTFIVDPTTQLGSVVGEMAPTVRWSPTTCRVWGW